MSKVRSEQFVTMTFVIGRAQTDVGNIVPEQSEPEPENKRQPIDNRNKPALRGVTNQTEKIGR
jgi:hypothetical protein